MDEHRKVILVLVAIAFVLHIMYRKQSQNEVADAMIPQKTTQRIEEIESKARIAEQQSIPATLFDRTQSEISKGGGLERLGLGNDPFGLKDEFKRKRRGAPEAAQLEQLQKMMQTLAQNGNPFEAMLKPINYPTTSGYGIRKDPIEMNVLKNHKAYDFGAPEGTPVPSPVPGKVIQAGPRNGYGISVEIKHSEKVSSLYAHLSKALVEAGQDVSEGQPVGLVGNTGRATGNNLHYELRVDGKPVNPQALVMLLAMLNQQTANGGQ
jgi:murein DD-endopeptidase MepM/ murein hydrolase activator NlpD